MPRKPKEPEFTPEAVRDISEQVYRVRLEQDKAGNVASMIKKDGDKGAMLRNRAGAYDSLTRVYMKVLRG